MSKILPIICGLLFIQNANAFDPETVHFSKMSTIKTWVAPKYHSNKKLMATIQKNVAETVPEKPNAVEDTMKLRNIHNKEYFGITFTTIAGIELPFLQKVHDISKNQQPVILEIAAGPGLVAWKIPFTFENKGTIYVNDLGYTTDSITELESESDKRLEHYIYKNLDIAKNLISSIKKIPGSCFDIPTEYPELENSVDVIYVQNLEHFFNPIQHQKFLNLIEQLLKPGGYAYLCAAGAEHLKYKEKNPFDTVYKKNERENKTYPGYIAFDRTDYYIGNTKMEDIPGLITNGKCSNYQTAHENTNSRIITTSQEKFICDYTKSSDEDFSLAAKISGLTEVEMTKKIKHIKTNYFSPTTYRRAVSAHNENKPTNKHLKVENAFYYHIKHDWSEEQDIFAAAIIRKKKDSESEEEKISTIDSPQKLLQLSSTDWKKDFEQQVAKETEGLKFPSILFESSKNK